MPGDHGGGPLSEGVRLLETMTYPEAGECIQANVPLLEYLRPDLVHADRKAAGGAKRVISYEVFPPTSDILWPNGIGNSALPASAELGRQLVELLVERIGRILDDEFPDR